MRSRRYQGGFWNFIIPAVAGFLGAQATNRTSQGIAADQMAFNAAEAEKQREFSSAQAAEARQFAAKMSETSYQRAVGDMKAAGLNPMLAYSQGGASSPVVAPASGSSAHYSSLPEVSNKVLAAINMASSAVQLQNLERTGVNIDADTELKKAQAHRETSSASQIEASKEKIVTAEIPLVRKQILQVEADTLNKHAQYAQTEALTLLSKLDAMVRASQIDQIEAQTALTKVDTVLKNLAVPEAKAYAEKFSGEFGKDVSPYLKEVVDILRVLIYGGRNR